MKTEKQKKVTLEDFSMISKIGKGSFAKVILVKKNDSNELYALKIMNKEFIKKNKQVKHVKTERNVLV